MPYNQTAVGMGSAPGAGGMGRDRITQALMNIQNPPPVSSMPQQPPPVIAPPGGGGGMTAAPGIGGAGTMPGAAPMMPQMNAAVPGAMQPGGAMAPGMGMGTGMGMPGQQQPGPMAQPPAMGAQY